MLRSHLFRLGIEIPRVLDVVDEVVDTELDFHLPRLLGGCSLLSGGLEKKGVRRPQGEFNALQTLLLPALVPALVVLEPQLLKALPPIRLAGRDGEDGFLGAT